MLTIASGIILALVLLAVLPELIASATVPMALTIVATIGVAGTFLILRFAEDYPGLTLGALGLAATGALVVGIRAQIRRAQRRMQLPSDVESAFSAAFARNLEGERRRMSERVRRRRTAQEARDELDAVAESLRPMLKERARLGTWRIKLEYTPWRGYAGPHISLTVHAGSVVGPSIRVRQRSAGAYEVMVGPGASTASAFGKEELLESLVDWVADQVGSERAARAVREASPRGALWRVTLRTVALLAAIGLLLAVAFCGP